MSVEGSIGFVEDRERIEPALGGAEDLLHHPELFVAQRNLDSRQLGVADAQHQISSNSVSRRNEVERLFR